MKRNVIKSCMFILILIMSLTFENLVWANNKGGGEAWSFLKIGTGARAIGMGGAFVSVADDATAIYWNPAGLVLLNAREITSMTILSSSMRYNTSSEIDGKHHYFSLCIPSEIGNFGVSLNWFKSGTIIRTEGTSIFDFHIIDDGGKSSSEWALTASYGLGLPNLNEGSNSIILTGFNLRYMEQSLFELSTSGLGFDAGIIIKTKYNEPIWILGNPRLGFVTKYNSTRKWQGTTKIDKFEYKVDNKYKDPSSMGWELGVSCEPKPNFIIAISLINTSNGSPLKMSIGNELRLFNDFLAIRAGLGSLNIQKIKTQKYNPLYETWKEEKSSILSYTSSFGIGFNIPIYVVLKIDYVYIINSLNKDHQISISAKF